MHRSLPLALSRGSEIACASPPPLPPASAHSRRRLGILEPKGESTSLALYDDTQLTKLAMAKTVHKEECAFCGKEGRHHASVLLWSR